ncbi:MAG: hypothetical protein JJ864_07630 [Rhizobiaceae bacterium]|nr:hypothetical protein [Rhizobiaceae bacterium]
MTTHCLEDEGTEAHHPEPEDRVPAEAEGMAGMVLFAAALMLIALAPFATRPPPAGRAWFLAPVNWPLLSLGLASIAGAILAWRFVTAWRADGGETFRRNALWAFGGFGGTLEYSLYFCIYLIGVAWLGFTLATLIFMQVTIWRSGLRGRMWVGAGIAVTLAIVVVFRLGIGLWFPLAPLFKLFPAWVGNSLSGVL